MIRPFLARCRLALAALLVALALSSTALAQQTPMAVPEAVGVSSARLDRLSDVLQGYVDEGRVAGIVALLTRGGKVVYHEAFGQRDVEAGAPMRLDTIFRIASQSKAVTSVAAMMLVEEGRILLSDPVGKYLPAFADTTVAVPGDNGGYDVVPSERPITVRDLLTHSTGVSYGDGPASSAYQDAEIYGWYFADKDEPIGVTVDRLATLPFNAHPGDEWIYGYSSDILGALIEQVSGTDLDSFFQGRILDPLGMPDTHFYLPVEKRDRLATVYAATADGGIERSPDVGTMLAQGAYVDGPRKSFSGGAGLLSTASDYARFLQMLLAGGALDGERLLSPKTVELMTVNHVADRFAWGAGAGFGLGFQVTLDLGATGQHGSDGVFSWGGAYHTTYWVDPAEDLVAVLMTQLIPAGNSDLQPKFQTLVYQAIVR